MRITRLYHPEQLKCGETVTLDANNSSHLVRVLRVKTGTDLILFNGDGFDYSCRTLDNNPKKTLISIESNTRVSNESNLHITLIQGLSRHDRMEQCIQKSVELGANKIIPVLCQRSNVRLPKDKKEKKIQHWKKIVISACEQSGRCILPEITEIVSIENIEQYSNQYARKIILNPTSQTSLKDHLSRIERPSQSIEVIVGPEGGFNTDEIRIVETYGFKSVQFGPRILRTETTGPAVISALQMLWGDF